MSTEQTALVGREAQLQFLEQYYEADGSCILVVYGPKGSGKTTMLRAFGEEKDVAYYAARACSDREQRFQWSAELNMAWGEKGECPAYEEILAWMSRSAGAEKKLLILDEFHHLIKGDASFFTKLNQFLKASTEKRMVVLCSSATGWVENSMVGKIGSEAASISGFLKVRELSPQNLHMIYPEFSENSLVQLYAVLGGMPGLWQKLTPNLSVAENLIQNAVNRHGSIYSEMSLYLAEELREPAVYNTILAVMASGSGKLNDIYMRTGFSRAKISVYLKNLMEIDLVEKVGSGTYRITKAHVRFYFRFLFPNQSLLEQLSPKQFYQQVMEEAFPDFVREAYQKG